MRIRGKVAQHARHRVLGETSVVKRIDANRFTKRILVAEALLRRMVGEDEGAWLSEGLLAIVSDEGERENVEDRRFGKEKGRLIEPSIAAREDALLAPTHLYKSGIRTFMLKPAVLGKYAL